MEDNNIEMMLAEIKTVVSNHLDDARGELNETMHALNTLPLVISLRKQINDLKKENIQLKNLLSRTNEEKNIELEIIEVDDKRGLEDPEENVFDFPTESSEEETDEEDDDEFAPAVSVIIPTANEQQEEIPSHYSDPTVVDDGWRATQISIEVWGREEEDNEQDIRKLLNTEIDVNTYGVIPTNFTTDDSHFVVKHGNKTYYTRDRVNGDLICGEGDCVGEVVGKLQNGTAFFS